MSLNINSIETCIESIQNGHYVFVVDDTEDVTPDVDIIASAHFITPQSIEKIKSISHSEILVSISQNLSKDLNLSRQFTHKPLQNKHITLNHSTPSSSQKLSRDIQLISINQTPKHRIQLLESKTMGVLKRAGHTEASTDLSYLSGFKEIGILSKCQDKDKSKLNNDDINNLSKAHNIPIMTIQELINFRNQSESYVKQIKEEVIDTEFGPFTKHTYEDMLNQKYHYALSLGGPFDNDTPTPVRVHSECLTGDVFGSLRCDCGPQLDAAMTYIQKEKKGVILYMRQEGRGIGLNNKVKAYKLQENGYDTVEANEMLGFKADLRDYGVGAQILQNLQLKKINLLTNNPRKIIGLKGYKLEIVKRIPIHIEASSYNHQYLSTKKDKLGHLFN